ncbi:Protein bimA [Candida viswanathii]|uniref:Protein bimA n=1 Tax=Candida viswanathii TaxID=5486 RepID=A0A367YCG4_9ASCO|nr:Protein bimA [Candida viswanathii]
MQSNTTTTGISGNNNNGGHYDPATSDPEANPKYVQQYLRSVIIHALDTLNYKNAEFASERLLAVVEAELEQEVTVDQQQQLGESEELLDSLYLYCLVLFKQDKHKTCYFRLNNLRKFDHHLGCSFLYAKCCLKLGKFKEGVFHLIKTKKTHESTTGPTRHSSHSNSTSRYLRFNYEFNRSITPDMSMIYHLLGDLYREIHDVKNSCLNYTQALKLNQFDFEAFQELCKLGVNIRVKSIFKFQNQATTHNNENIGVSGGNAVGGGAGAAGGAGTNDASMIPDLTNPFNDKNLTSKVTPSIHVDEFNFSTPRIKNPSIPDAPLRKSNLNSSGAVGGSSSTNHNLDFEFAKPSFPDDRKKGTATTAGAGTYSRITSRLISQPQQNQHHHHSNSHHQTQSQGQSQSQQPSSSSAMETPKKRNLKRNNSATLESIHQPTTSSSNSTSVSNPSSSNSSIIITKEIEKSEKYLLLLYQILGKSFRSMCKYDCYKAIRILETSLNSHEKQTPWVLSKLGRLHYEIVNYQQSEYYFNKLRKLDRTRLEDMEYFLTLLWHLNKKVELTYLANELHDLNPNAATTWCTIGNLFSLTHEPDEAIKCFNRAIKLDKNFTYAYTLKGHEYFSSDNYEMALENFRISLVLDPRHYNALYGIGMVYINHGDYEKADYHFRKAISINPINIILICCCGMVLEKLNKKNLAIKQYELANKLQPLNPLPIFKLGQLYFGSQQYNQALKNFEILKNLAPDEASVHFLLGQLYNLQNDKFLAIKEFTIALNLDPKGNYLIREAMESLKS